MHFCGYAVLVRSEFVYPHDVETVVVKGVGDIVGQLPQPLKLKKVEITPKELEVFAPSARQDNKAPSIFTTPVYLSSITGNTTLIRKIVAPPSIQPMDKRWPDVEVVITVE